MSEPRDFDTIYYDLLQQQAWDRAQATVSQGQVRQPARTPADYAGLIDDAAQRHGVDPALVAKVVQVESNFDPRAVSRAGAQGLMQLMPGTARRFGVRDPFDPGQNVEGGTQYLAWLLRRFKGDTRLALAGYNAGEGTVEKYGDVPPYPETQRYVQKILAQPMTQMAVAGETTVSDMPRYQSKRERQPTPQGLSAASQDALAQMLPTLGQASLTAAPSLREDAPMPSVEDITQGLAHPVVTPAQRTLEAQRSALGLAARPEAPMAPFTPTEGVEEAQPTRGLGFIGTGAVQSVQSFLDFIPALSQAVQGSNQPGVLSGLAGLAQDVRAALEPARQGMQPTIMGQPTFWDQVASAFGTSLPPMVLGALSGGALVGSGVAAVTEAAQEAGNVYQELLPLMSEAQASTQAMKSFGANVILVGLTDRLGIFGDTAPLRRTLSSIITNGVQEAVQYDIERRQFALPPEHPQAAALKKQGWVDDGRRLYKPFALQDAAEAALIGMVVGGAASAGYAAALEQEARQAPPGSPLALLRQTLEQQPDFHLADGVQALQSPDTPPAGVDQPTWQRWAQNILDLLPEPGEVAGAVRQVLGSERGALDLFGAPSSEDGGTPDEPRDPRSPVADERQPSPEQLGLAGGPQQTVFRLPPQLAQAKPRMGTVHLDFTSDVDKTAYIVANQAERSQGHAAYLQELMDYWQVPERAAITRAQAIRDQVVAYARQHGTADSALQIPAMQQAAGQAQSAALAQPGVMPTTQIEMGAPLVGNETQDMQGLPLLDKDTMSRLRDFLKLAEGERAQHLVIDGKPLEINYNYINTDDGVKQVLSAVSELYLDEVAKIREPVTREHIAEEARKLHMTIADFLQTDRENLVSAKKAMLAREMTAASAKQMRVATAMWRTGQLSGRDLLRSFALHTAIQTQFARLANEWGRTGATAFQQEVAGDPLALKGFAEMMQYLGSKGINEDILAAMIEHTPTPEQLQLVVEQAPTARARDFLLPIWYGTWMLSRPLTQVKNLLSNVASFAEGALTRAIAAHVPGAGISQGDAIQRALYAEQPRTIQQQLQQTGQIIDPAAPYMRDVEAGEANAYVYGALRATEGAWRLLSHAFRLGETLHTLPADNAWRMATEAFLTGQSSFETHGKPTYTAEGLEQAQTGFYRTSELVRRTGGPLGPMWQATAKGPLAYLWDALGAIGQTVSNGMIAVDEFGKAVHYQASKHAMAWRLAVEQGVQGTSMDEAMTAMHDFLQKPPPAAQERLMDEVHRQVFQRPMEELGMFGAIGAGVQKGAELAPLLRLFVPFTRTPANMPMYMLEDTPLLAMALGEVREDIARGGAYRDMALARQALGGLTIGAMLVAVAGGVQFIGRGATKRDERTAEREVLQRQAYSMRIPWGDRHLTISLGNIDPLAQYVGFLTDWWHYTDEVYASSLAEEAGLFLAAGGKALARNVFNRTYTRGFADFMELVWGGDETKEPGEQLNEFARWTRQQARGMVPGFVQTVTRVTDPVMAEVQGAWDAFTSQLPFGKKVPHLNFWAEPVTPPYGLFNPFQVVTEAHDPVMAELIAKHAALAGPSRYLLQGRTPRQGAEDLPVELPPAAWNRLKTLFAKEVTNTDGETLRSALATQIASAAYQADAAYPEKQQRALNTTIRAFLDDAHTKFLEENKPSDAPYHTLIYRYLLGGALRKAAGSGQSYEEAIGNVDRTLQVGAPR